MSALWGEAMKLGLSDKECWCLLYGDDLVSCIRHYDYTHRFAEGIKRGWEKIKHKLAEPSKCGRWYETIQTQPKETA